MLNNNIQTTFSIKDLENLSGIKAHTIRIWEKRYNLLEPDRSDTNIRSYDIKNLQRLLNIAFLNDNGIKISKIANLDDEKIYAKVREIISSNNSNDYAFSSFKLAMLNFDETLFNSTYNNLLAKFSFREIFLNIFIELFDEIGMLWATNTITPAHEHFLSNLVKQKILINIERVQSIEKTDSKTFVLFLPINEIHEIGLLYILFELTLKGYHCVYLGESLPVENLTDLQKIFEKLEYITYFTIKPEVEELPNYLENINSLILSHRNEKLHILGRRAQKIDPKHLNKNSTTYENLLDFINSV